MPPKNAVRLGMRKLRPFIFRPELSIELQAGRKWNQIGYRGNSETEIHHGLFVDLLIATLIRRMEVGIYDDFGKRLVPTASAELGQTVQPEFQPWRQAAN